MTLKKQKQKCKNKQKTVTLMTKDRALNYANDVISGDVVAGPYVRGACLRHIHDIEKANVDPVYPFYYDQKEAAHSISFFEEKLCLNGGQFEGKPFILIDWQAFIIGSLFGWKRKSDNMRRFRVAYVETAKGSGKSPLAAGIGLKGLCADKEPRAEIYAAATYQKQAMVLFKDAIAFYDQSPELQKRLKASGTASNRWKLEYLEKHSTFEVISSEKKQSGPRPHMALLDEIHEHPDNAVIEMLRAGFKWREQPLSFMITNSGYDRSSVCWDYHESGRKIACELEQNDEGFYYICSLDDEDFIDDKYLTDESLWVKVNPSLAYGLPGYDYIRGQVKEAIGMSAKMSTVKRLCFCVWTESDNPWISSEIWMPCIDKEFDESLLAGRSCWGGLDLSAVNDLTAFALMFEPCDTDPLMRLKVFFWVPGEDILRKSEIDHVPYDAWKRQGYIYTCNGRAISYGQVARFIFEETRKYQLQGIAYDRNYMKFFINDAEKEGIELAIGKWDSEKRVWNYDNSAGIKINPFGQEPRSMAPAIDKFERFLLQKQFRHDGNPCLTWCASNVVVDSDDHGYRKMSKKKSVGRIDGIVAAVMACGIFENSGDSGISGYEGKSVEEITSGMVF